MFSTNNGEVGEMPMVQSVKKHSEKPMAFVNFSALEIAQAILQDPDPATSIGAASVDPVVPHKNGGPSIVLHWKGGDLSDEEIAAHFEQRAAELIGGWRDAAESRQAMESQSESHEFSTNNGEVGEMPMVQSVKKHSEKPMAFVNFSALEIAQAILQDPDPATSIGAASVDPVVPHKNGGPSIVLHWKGGDLSDEEIAAHFEQRAAELIGGWRDAAESRQAMESQSESHEEPVVIEVRPHGSKAMAYVAFKSPDIAALVCSDRSGGQSINGVPIDPTAPHKMDAEKVVLYWKGAPDQLSPEDIAAHFEQRVPDLLNGNMASGRVPNIPRILGGKGTSNGSSANNLGHAKSVVTGVRPHGAKAMAYVAFNSPDIAALVCSDRSDGQSINGVPIDPTDPHKNDADKVVLYWKGAHGQLSPDDIAVYFEQHVTELQKGNTGFVGVPKISTLGGKAARKGSAGFDSWHAGPFVTEVRPHGSKAMAYVAFKSPDIAALVCSDRSGGQSINGVPIDPTDPHKNDADKIVLYWKGAPGQLSPEDIAVYFEQRVRELQKGSFGFVSVPKISSPGSKSARKGSSPFDSWHAEPLVTEVRPHGSKAMAYVAFNSPDIAALVCSDRSGGQSINGVPIDPTDPHKNDADKVVLYWKGLPGQLSPEDISAYFEQRVRELRGMGATFPRLHDSAQLKRPALGGTPLAKRAKASHATPLKSVMEVKAHQSQPMAYVKLSSPDLVHAVLSSPQPAAYPQFKWPPLQHQSHPDTLVVRFGWTSGLGEQDVANCMEAILSELTATPGLVTEVKKHQSQPMAYVKLAAPDLVQVVLSSARPAEYPQFAWPPREHQSQPDSLVVRFDGNPLMDEHEIASYMEAILHKLMAEQGLTIASGEEAYPQEMHLAGSILEVKAHPSQPMAYVKLSSPDLVQVVLSSPQPADYPQFVWPPREHQSEPDTLVVRFGGSRWLNEHDIANIMGAILQKLTTGEGLTIAPDGKAYVHEEVDKAGCVIEVKAHDSQPMAYVKLSSPDLVQAALSSPQPLAYPQFKWPPLQHQSQPDTLVVRFGWNSGLSEQDIANCMEAILSDLSELTTSTGLVTEVKKHLSQPMAYVKLATPDLVQVALSSARPAEYPQFAWPPREHQSRPDTLVVRFDGHPLLHEQEIAGYMEAILQELMAEQGLTIASGDEAYAQEVEKAAYVVEVKSHPSQPMAYVKLSSPDLVQVVLSSPQPEGYPQLKWPPLQHQSQLDTLVVRFGWNSGLSGHQIGRHMEDILCKLMAEQETYLQEVEMALTD